MKYAVITGVSRGLGESVAKLFMESGIHVIGISRNHNKSLIACAQQNNVVYQHYRCDLGELGEVEETVERVSSQIFAEEPESIYIVNNAAVLEPIAPATSIKNTDLKYHVQINTIAPMVLINSLLQTAVEQDVRMIGVTITSGAAERPVFGWSAYCSTKASINMYTQAVALEQEELKTGNKVIAFNPGIMDTQMQEKIRASSADDFIEVDTFRDYKKKDLLKDTEAVGGVLVDILTDEESIENGKIYNVKDYF
ncbi:(S)-benzoin forming benzil reductase [Virgibacillus dakarensis]|uniref:Short-chain dehydrogenase n=1 Tax=Lentibacillus populi TaxID=1827502 RepID=A0A9W5U266_9BACI|nr:MULTISPECIES: (S)-benzoin forming benzil reductase [Bacillaceae]MBT2218247.1 (S)-benzoin forming benzil reductase [Virgibacillus dakarensis]MTW85541.1 (S)-benzoin forming benzil reductase [Virgibacillus dakarensis]GGB62899.1 short-chain dehydrogenase [Lentibacillus populi]